MINAILFQTKIESNYKHFRSSVVDQFTDKQLPRLKFEGIEAIKGKAGKGLYLQVSALKVSFNLSLVSKSKF